MNLRYAWLVGVLLTLAGLCPLRAQTVNPDCTGVGYVGGGGTVLGMFCAKTGCTGTCDLEVVSTLWGDGTGEQCRCDYIGPPPNCCRLTLVHLPWGKLGFTTQGQCDFPSCNDKGNCWLTSILPPGGTIVEFYAICEGDDVKPVYGPENLFEWNPPDVEGGEEEEGDPDGDGN